MTRLRAVGLALALSAMLHGMFAWLTSAVFVLPPVAFTLQEPELVEFGFVDEGPSAPTEPVRQASQPRAEPPPANLSARDIAELEDVLAPDPTRTADFPDGAIASGAAPDSAVPDAATPDGSTHNVILDAAVTDATVSTISDADDGGCHDAASPPTVAAIPRHSEQIPKGQVSLKLNLAAIRRSAHATLLREVIARLPDVRALLHGSGVDVVEDLDRLWTGTPDLSRERAAIVGVHRRAPGFAEEAAKQLARTSARPIRFRRQGALRVAPWHNDDPTARTLALLGKRHFIISRETDLASMVQMATAHPAPSKSLQAPNIVSALLALKPGTLLEAQIEGVRNYVAAPDPEQLPVRMTARVTGEPAEGIMLNSTAEFATGPSARQAKILLKRQLHAYGRQPLVMLFGLSGVLQRAAVTVNDNKLVVRFKLDRNQARTLLTSVRDGLPPTP